jgi:isoleucyl-tRNA synthetase
MDYKETLNLPKTDFPMKANLFQREPEMLKRWAELDLYGRLEGRATQRPTYILHDGPPYANGHIHIGHALNKTLKDIILKVKRMEGFHAPYVPGWDCHGLPIELQVEKDLGSKKNAISKAEMRKACRQYAQKFIGIQRDEFKRLGILGDWENPYLTMTNGYEGQTAAELAAFAHNGGLYRGRKPVHWCSSCVTALAEAEVEYADHTSPSIYVRFKLLDDIAAQVPAVAGHEVFVVIWTTTPWTIPANLAIALHPEYTYCALAVNGQILIVAEGLKDQFMAATGISGEVLATFPGALLERRLCQHPLYDRTSVILLGEHVTLETGTGCVHTAPGHGQEDYELALKEGLEIYNPVDNYGRYLPTVERFGGERVFDANPKVMAALEEAGALVGSGKLEHSYPHCWRCKKPIIFRATEQWFISMEANGLREKSLSEIDRVRWIPKWGRDRIYGMVENRPDWCISRQRSWGVPITAFSCTSCGSYLADGPTMDHVAELFREHSSDIWFEWETAQLLPPGAVCPDCGGTGFEKENDILDVWFDSGVSHAAVLEQNPKLSAPADLYLEGSDQHRGWFHSSLLESVGTRGHAPYHSVLTHGFVLDGQGRKMSKSMGNVVAPEDVIKKYGADVLRLWCAAQDYRDDNRISDEILNRVAEAYRRIRNTSRFMLGNLFDFDPANDALPFDQLRPIDRLALHHFEVLKERALAAYASYEFHVIYQAVNAYCTVELSAQYLDILKDRLYTSRADALERRSSQTAMYQILDGLTRLLAPLLSFTSDEVWSFMPGTREESIHLAGFPALAPEQRDDALAAVWDELFALRGEILKALEQKRVDKLIGHPLDAAVTVHLPAERRPFVLEHLETLQAVCIVSQLHCSENPLDGGYTGTAVPEMTVLVSKAAGEKCERCWCYSESLGSDAAHPTLCPKCTLAVV